MSTSLKGQVAWITGGGSGIGRGVFGGGSSITNVMDYIAIATTGNVFSFLGEELAALVAVLPEDTGEWMLGVVRRLIREESLEIAAGLSVECMVVMNGTVSFWLMKLWIIWPKIPTQSPLIFR